MKHEKEVKVSRVLLVAGITVLPLVAYHDYLNGHTLAMVAKLLTSALCALGLYLSVIKRVTSIPPMQAVALLLMASVGALTKQGDSTGLLWAPAVVMIFYFLADLRLGNRLTILYFIALVAGYLLHPILFTTERMPLAVWMQGMLAYLITATVAALYERMRLDHAAQLQRVADHDFLTGVLNRRGFLEQAVGELHRAEREGRTLALIMFDLDNFKQVNDGHGHERGDALLRQFSERIGRVIRRGDIFGRWGGEEFILLLSSVRGDSARELAETMRGAIADIPFPVLGRVTCSMGMSLFAGGEDIGSLISRADEALYRAKEGGKNRIEEGLSFAGVPCT